MITRADRESALIFDLSEGSVNPVNTKGEKTWRGGGRRPALAVHSGQFTV